MPSEDVPKSVKPEDPILSHIIVDEGVLPAMNRAEEFIKQAKLNEAIDIIEQLEREVATMAISSRFSREKIVSDSPYAKPNMVPTLVGLTEEQFKRTQLLRDLNSIKNEIFKKISDIKTVVLDIEATKQEG